MQGAAFGLVICEGLVYFVNLRSLRSLRMGNAPLHGPYDLRGYAASVNVVCKHLSLLKIE